MNGKKVFLQNFRGGGAKFELLIDYKISNQVAKYIFTSEKYLKLNEKKNFYILIKQPEKTKNIWKQISLNDKYVVKLPGTLFHAIYIINVNGIWKAFSYSSDTESYFIYNDVYANLAVNFSPLTFNQVEDVNKIVIDSYEEGFLANESIIKVYGW